MSTVCEECFSRNIRIGGWPFGMTVGTQARWFVKTAVRRAGKNLDGEKKARTLETEENNCTEFWMNLLLLKEACNT